MVPLVSIVIPCRNEVAFIESCLASVFAFEPIDGVVEVIIADGMSTDGTREVLSRWVEEHPNVRVVDNPGLIAPKALNAAIKAARGEFILRLDAHSTYPSDYLRTCFETMMKSGADNVGGIVLTLMKGETLQERLVKAISTSRFGVGNSEFRLGGVEGPVDTVPFGFFRRSVFERIGWFDERLVRNQDYEMNRRIVRAGGNIWMSPRICAQYYNRTTLGKLFKQAFFTSQWNPWMWAVAPYSFAPRHAVPGLFVLGLISGAVASLFIHLAAFALGAVLLLYLLADLAASVDSGRRNGWAIVPLLPPLFFAYHLCYGLGTLWGAVLLMVNCAPVQRQREPWPEAGRYRPWREADRLGTA